MSVSVPKLIAHRGYPLHYPENTLIGLEAAVRAGTKFFEIDVQLTADLVPFLFHDRTLNRVCGVPGKIHKIHSSKLLSLRASEPGRFGEKFEKEPVASLESCTKILRAHPEVTGFIEVKRATIGHFGAELVLEKVLEVLDPVAKQCVLISFSTDLLILAHKQNWYPLGGVIENWKNREHASVLAAHPEYLFCDVQGLPPSGELSFEAAKLVVYEIGEGSEALELAKRGVDFIETFAVGEMLAYFREMPSIGNHDGSPV